MTILWAEATSGHIARSLCHDDVTRQIIIKELQFALDLWMCTSWQDLVKEAALKSWEEAPPQHISEDDQERQRV